jgi:membrane-bound lytic murein transglycosylase B
LALLTAALFYPGQAATSRRDDAPISVFVEEMVSRHGFAEAELSRLMDDASVLPQVVEAISKPAEAKPWYKYRPIFVTPERISEGIKFWQAHEATLNRAQATFGVAPEIIVAIIGIETRYGQRTGSFRVLDSLVTLAFHFPKRGRFFRSELEQFLLLTREERFDPLALKGSYAGAMGLPQFISSSYREYAVDFDGDAVRDLLYNEADAIGSVANYLQRHGWQPGAAVAVPAKVQGDEIAALLKSGIKPHLPVRELRARGVQIAGAIEDEHKGALVELETEEGPQYWLGLQNFYTITRYNHSPLYAMAVLQLAEATRAKYGTDAS